MGAGSRHRCRYLAGLLAKAPDGSNRRPEVEEIITYLQGLTGHERDKAARYVRKAPPQIDTAYRRRIDAEVELIAADAK